MLFRLFAGGESDHASVDGEPSLIFELFRRLDEQVSVGFMTELDINPELVTGLVMKFEEGHAFEEFGSHPIDVDIDCRLN